MPIKPTISMVDCVSVSMAQRHPSFDPETSSRREGSPIKTQWDYIILGMYRRNLYKQMYTFVLVSYQ